jgi:hypothetical protein
MNKPYNIQNTNICNGIFHISFFKALLIYEGERESGRNDLGQNYVWLHFQFFLLLISLYYFFAV